ncbi:MAG: PAS domain S-box protein, partial [Methanoregula sp.]|nr:PAS domain S-box protein [Methanoregula sp.]
MSPISVLYVDDEPGLLEIGKLFLERKGQFIVDTITSATAAFTLLDTKTYDAIISDYQMPEMDGIKFLKTIRASGNTIPFILFTGRGREEVVIQALNEGADFYLQKGGEPVSQFTELAHQIRQAIQKRRAEASIRDLERRESDIINFQPDATVAIDRAGHIIAWNRAMEEVTGVSTAEMLGKGDYEYSVPFYGKRQPTLIDLIFESDENIAKKYAHIIHKNDTLIADTIYPTLRGESVTFMAMASPLYNRQGEVIGAIESIRDITERKQAEEALRESEKKYRQIVETTDEGIWKLDEKFGTAYVNRWMADMLGYTPEEMSGRSYISFMAAEDKPDQTSLLEERREGKRGRYECRFMTKDGRIRWMQVSATPLLDPDGTFRGSFGMCSDITDRKIAEEEIACRNQELRAAYEQLTATEEKLQQNYDKLVKSQNLLLEREKQYRRIVETAKEGILQVDEKFETIYVNQQMADMLGYTPEEMMGRRQTSFVAEEDLPDQITRLKESRQGKCGRFERRFMTKDGRIRWMQVSATPLLDPDGTFRGSFGMCSDITAHKAAEEEIVRRNEELHAAYEQVSAAEEKLQQNYNELAKNQNLILESEKQYRQIVETTNEGICQLDEKLEMVYINRRMAEMHGCTPEEMMGQNIAHFMVAEEIPVNISRIKERRLGTSSRYERRFVTKDGRIRWTQVSSTPLFDPDGTFRGSFAMYSDITDRKAAEEEMACRNQELRAAYEQLTTTEEKLQQNYDELAKHQDLLRESEQRYRNVIEDQTEFICRFLPDGTHVFVNEAYCRYFGLTREEIVGHRFRPKIPVEDQESMKRFFASLTPAHPVDSIEHRIIMPDGTIRWQRWSDRAIFNHLGKITEYQSVGRDITEEKATQTALEKSGIRFRQQYQNSPLPIVTWQHREGDFVLVDCNRAAETISGRELHNFHGRTASDL